MNLGAILARHARYRPNHTAVAVEDRRFSYREFNERVNRLANALAGEGISRGHKVATFLPNCVEILDLYWAVSKIGAVAVPLSPLLGKRALVQLLNHSDSVMVFAPASAAQVFHELQGEFPRIPRQNFIFTESKRVPGFRSFDEFVQHAATAEPPDMGVHEHDPLMIIYSSGTTGDPKGIVLSHYVRAMYCTLYALAWRMTPESVSLHAGSLVFNGAFMTLLPSFFLGGTFVVHRQFDAESVIATIEREKVTHMVVVPTQLTALLNSSKFSTRALKSLEAAISMGAPLHRQHKEQFSKRLPGRFYELYGLAEGFMTILDKNDDSQKLGSVGTPPPFFEMRIVREDGTEADVGEMGEIVGRGPILMQGYYNRPDLTAKAIADGWLHSGDLGYIDEDGFLYLVDRKKDMIKSGGVSVYPRDVEEVIVQHPAVKEAAVFGVPDEKWGETPVAAVILTEPNAVDAEVLRRWINDNVAAKFQRVSAIQVLSEFPRNAAGKTLKRTLRDLYLGR